MPLNRNNANKKLLRKGFFFAAFSGSTLAAIEFKLKIL
jgi:hypothetical protein